MIVRRGGDGEGEGPEVERGEEGVFHQAKARNQPVFESVREVDYRVSGVS